MTAAGPPLQHRKLKPSDMSRSCLRGPLLYQKEGRVCLTFKLLRRVRIVLILIRMPFQRLLLVRGLDLRLCRLGLYAYEDVMSVYASQLIANTSNELLSCLGW